MDYKRLKEKEKFYDRIIQIVSVVLFLAVTSLIIVWYLYENDREAFNILIQ